jgi:hypothetical protein
VIAGLLCSFALLTKQTAVWVIGLIGLWLLIMDRSPKELIIFSLMVLIPFAAFITAVLPSNALDLKLNIVNGLKNGIGISWFYNVFIKGYFIRYAILIVFGIYIGGWLLAEKKPGLKSFIGFGILYFFICALGFSLKYGATQNYFIEFTIMIVFGIAYLIENNHEIHKPYLPLVALYIPFFLMTCANDKGWKSISSMKSSKRDFKECEMVSDYVQKNIQPGNYIYSTAHTENCLNLMLVQQALFPCREVAFVQTYPLGVFKFNKFQEILNNGNLQYIIDKKDAFPKKILYAEPKYFIPDTTIGNYTVYRNASNTIGKF